jgi:hypothetical protein
MRARTKRSLTVTSEGLHRIYAVGLYARLLITLRLLPLLRAGAPELARVVSIAAGSKEGSIDTEDWQALKASLWTLTGHGASLATLAFQHLAKEAPEVTFINTFPGLVMTGALKVMTGTQGYLVRTVAYLVQRWLAVPLEESGARHVFLATSSTYKPKTGSGDGVPLVEGLPVHAGVDDEIGSGVYSVNWDGEGPGAKVVRLLRQYNDDGTAEKAWTYFTCEIERVLSEPV